jgi:hypothetical protein
MNLAMEDSVKKSFLVLTLVSLVACTKSPREQLQPEYSITKPAVLELGKQARFALAGNFSGKEAFQWNVIGARIEGAADGSQVTIVPTQQGTVTVGCTIQTPDGKPIAIATSMGIGGPNGAVLAQSVPGPPDSIAGSPTTLKIDDAGFVPSGWMGEYTALKIENSTVRPHFGPYSQMLSYQPKSSGEGWAAVAWQFPQNNWGERPGKNLSANHYRSVTVWARGVPDSKTHMLPKIQFKAGGNTNPDKTKYPYQASFEVVGDFISLTDDWKQYSLDLSGQDLSQVISALTVVIKAQDVGPSGATFYLEDIEYVR